MTTSIYFCINPQKMISTVIDLYELNKDVFRIMCDDSVFFDMSMNILSLKKNDKLVIDACQPRDNTYDVVLQGVVYGRDGDYLAASFGGLIAQLPICMDVGDNPIIIGIKKQ